MYNFFSNKLKMRAFKAALKQIEAEGFYVNLNVDKEAMPILPDMSKAVASLSGKSTKDKSPSAETLNISELSSELGAQKATSIEQRRASSILDAVDKKEQTASQFYEGLFKSSPSFLSDDELDEPEFLSGQPTQHQMQPDTSTTAEAEENYERRRNEIFKNLAEKSKARRAEQHEKNYDTVLSLLRNKVEEDIPPIEADIQMPEMEAEPEPQPKPAEVKVEVVADIPKPEPPKTITKTVYVTKEVPVPVEVPAPPKPKVKKSTTPRKKKRKYDADISGGFNY